jgi:hypothetical protein
MKRAKKEILTKKTFYPKYLKLVNVILPEPLTNKEIEVLSSFMELEGDLVDNDRFGTQARSHVRAKLGFKTNANLDNYIKYFKKKNIIQVSKKTGKLEINPKIAIPKNETEISLTFEFTVK